MVVAPGALAVIFPFEDTVAMALLRDDHMILFLVPATLKVFVVPAVRVTVV